MNDIKVGDTVKAGFSMTGQVLRIIHKPWGPVAVIRGNGMNREIPVSSLRKV